MLTPTTNPLLKRVYKMSLLKSSIEQLEEDFIKQFDAILIKEGMRVFVLWAKAFPTRDLRFVSGMGAATWASEGIDESSYLLDIDEVVCNSAERLFWSDRYATMLQPLTDFNTLFWSGNYNKYPSFSDIIYNPITKTVKCGDNIIKL